MPNFFRYTARASRGVIMVDRERRKATDVAAVSSRAMLLSTYDPPMHRLGRSQSFSEAALIP